MKIILRQDYDNLGNAGDILEVKNGFARNFLIPNGIAWEANDSNVKHFQDIRKQQGRKLEKQLEEAKKLAGDLSGVSIDIFVKTGEEDRLFGSVTTQNIHDALIEKGYANIDKRKIHLAEPIKSLGAFEADVKLHSNVIAKVKVNVKKEGADDSQEIVSESIAETVTEENVTE